MWFLPVRLVSVCPFSGVGPVLYRDFDATLGFPGEGPFVVQSLNVGSLGAHPDLFESAADLLLLQEARLSVDNVRTTAFRATEAGRQLHPGPLLPVTPDVNGVRRVEWGGLAALSQGCLVVDFPVQQDVTGCLASMLSSGRFQVVWIHYGQLRILAINFYGVSGATSDDTIFQRNQEYLAEAFNFAAPFLPDHPVLFAGDFQACPTHYPAVSDALATGLWIDPFEPSRPDQDRQPTFCRDKTWAAGSPTTTIDTVLVNMAAASLLHHVEVTPLCGYQHAAVALHLVATSEVPRAMAFASFAPLDLGALAPPEACAVHAEGLWNDRYQAALASVRSAEEAWSLFSEFALSTLLGCGARWGRGVRSRGSLPPIRPKRPLVRPLPTSHPVVLYARLLSLARELFFRVVRLPMSAQPDASVTLHTLRRFRCLARQLRFPCTEEDLTPQGTAGLCERAAEALRVATHARRQASFKRWKERLRHSALHTGKEVFQHLQRATTPSGSNHLAGPEGVPAFHPAQALSHAAAAWNEVFNVHREGIPVEPLMRPIQHLLEQRAVPLVLLAVTPEDLASSVARRSPDSSSGLDGWAAVELRALPVVVFRVLAHLFNRVEAGEWCLPRIFGTARLAVLDKGAGPAPLAKRLIAVLPIAYLAWSSARFRASTAWQRAVLPQEVVGGVSGRRVDDVTHELALDLHEAKATNDVFAGVQIDRSKCFDRLLPAQIVALLTALGFPPGVAEAWRGNYRGFRRFLSWRGAVHEEPLGNSNGIAQGCSLSVLAANVLMSAWILLIKHFPGVSPRVYVDDGYLNVVTPEAIDSLVLAVRATSLFDGLAGQQFNLHKSGWWSTQEAYAPALQEAFPQAPRLRSLRPLGVCINLDLRGTRNARAEAISRFRRAVRAIGALPLGPAAKATFVARKAMPMLTYSAELNTIPKRQLSSLASEVAAVLWEGRPAWRSRELLLAVVYRGHLVHPGYALPYRAILNVVAHLQRSEAFALKWRIAFTNPRIMPSTLVANFIAAITACGMRFSAPASVAFHVGPWISLFTVSTRSLRKLLQWAIAQHAYQVACRAKRTDIVPGPTGLLDVALARSPWSVPSAPNWTAFARAFPCNRPVAPAVVVGSAVTADRLYSAGMASSPLCRFCGGQVETIAHLVLCQALPRDVGPPPLQREVQGPSFFSHALPEIPPDLVSACCAQVPWPTTSPWPRYSQDTHVHLWTDGSVFLPQHPFFAAAGFAVVSATRATIACGSVPGVFADNYRAEVYAILRAAQLTRGGPHCPYGLPGRGQRLEDLPAGRGCPGPCCCC